MKRRQFDVANSPDLTRRIMGRLGYMRVAPAVARRNRIKRWANRAGTVMVAAVALAIAIRVYEGSSAVRVPNDLTIPAAIGNDVRDHQERIGSFIRTFRHLTTPQPQSVPPSTPGANSPVIPNDPDSAPAEQIDGDFVKPATSPFRWV